MTTRSDLQFGVSVLRARLCVCVLALLSMAGCVSGADEGTPSSSGSHWLSCEADGDCTSVLGTCGATGVCVDASGAPVVVEPMPGSIPAGGTVPTPGSVDAGPATGGGSDAGSGTAGGPGAGSGGSGGSGGSDGGSSYDPCAGKACGETCTRCDPTDSTCFESADVKSCDMAGVCQDGVVGCVSTGVVLPDCAGLSDGVGASCSGRDDQPVPECCQGAGMHLRCEYNVCNSSLPANCNGAWAAVAGSTSCGAYEPCGGKGCGDTCTVCDPTDAGCAETAEVKACSREGQCTGSAVDCAEPASCQLLGPDTCPTGQVCCAVGRCGPLARDQGMCEPTDPLLGGCAPCACESQPGGCPICNSPDTPILTPDGERPIAELAEGDLVMSMHGGQLVAVPVVMTRRARVFDHAVVRLELDNGTRIEVSGSHPTADGRRLDALQPGDALGELHVLSIELVPYQHDHTYDILPASDSGSYFAGGALLGSTLWVR